MNSAETILQLLEAFNRGWTIGKGRDDGEYRASRITDLGQLMEPAVVKDKTLEGLLNILELDTLLYSLYSFSLSEFLEGTSVPSPLIADAMKTASPFMTQITSSTCESIPSSSIESTPTDDEIHPCHCDMQTLNATGCQCGGR